MSAAPRGAQGAPKPRVLVLAGLDPSGRAGLLADGVAVRAQGAMPILCATAIAAQSNARLVAAEPVSAGALRAQIVGAVEDGPIAAIKVGMIGSRGVLGALVEELDAALRGIPLVLDPVLQTSRGGRLFEGEPDELVALFARCRLITPNLPEAALLSGYEVGDESAMHEAAARIALRGARAVLLKGGHLGGSPADLLLDGGRIRWFRGERVGASRRGTGCRLASAIAARLAWGDHLETAVERGIAYVRRYLLDGDQQLQEEP